MTGSGRGFRAALIFVVGAWGCVGPSTDAPDGDLQEAALHWAFGNEETILAPPAAHCLYVSPRALAGGGDPDRAFLERYGNDSIPVRPGSACRFEGGSVRTVIDTVTGQYALLFTVSPVVWEDPERPTVEVGFLQGGEGGAGWRCSFEASEGDWILEDCDRTLDV